MGQKRSHTPTRTCSGCFKKTGKKFLLRFVIKNGATIKIDPAQTEHGRGHYICPDPACLNRFLNSTGFRKICREISSLQKEVFKTEMEKMIFQNRVYSLVGLANKAGKVAIGNRAVEAALKKGRAKLVVLAQDAASNTIERFEKLGKQYDKILRVYGFKKNWGHLFGREHSAVFAILNDNFARAINSEIEQIKSE